MKRIDHWMLALIILSGAFYVKGEMLMTLIAWVLWDILFTNLKAK